jgi:hypothetical protein
MADQNRHPLVRTNFRRQGVILGDIRAMYSFSTDVSGIYYTRAAAIFSNIPVQISFLRYGMKLKNSAPIWLDFDMSSSASGPWLVFSCFQLCEDSSVAVFRTLSVDSTFSGWLEAPVISV